MGVVKPAEALQPASPIQPGQPIQPIQPIVPIDATLEAVKSPLERGLERTHADTDAHEAGAGRPSAAARIGRFQILHEIGAGGMGVVYAAYDSSLDRKVALKLILQRDSHSRAGDRLQREAQAMARISHPNVVHIYDVGEHDEQIYVAMEFIDGIKLSDWLAEASPSWSEILDVFIAAGRGLQAAHEAGVVHRDFKPDNVVMRRRADGDTRRLQPKVLDFGLAAVAFEEPDAATTRPEELALSTSARLTITGSLMGTPRYMSPEQFASVPSEPRSDQFSFAVALYEALYHQHPFAAEDFSELRAAVLNGELREPPDSEIPPWIFEVLARALQRVPSHRFASMEELIAAIQEHPERVDPDLDRTVAMRQRIRLVSALTVVAVGFFAILIYLRLYSEAGIPEYAFWSKIAFASGALAVIIALRKVFDRNGYNRRFATMIVTLAAAALLLTVVAHADGLSTDRADRYILATISLCFLQASASVERLYLWIALLGAVGVALSFTAPFIASLALGVVIFLSTATATFTWRRRRRRSASGTLSGRLSTSASLRRSGSRTLP